MRFKKIITKRHIETLSSWDLVYEWENEISRALGASFFFEKGHFKGKKRLENLISKYPQLYFLIQTYKKAFVFEMSDYRTTSINNESNIVPCIIDAYVGRDDIDRFTMKFNKNKFVFVTSRQVYEYLIQFSFPFRLGHLPITLPSKYKIDGSEKYEKKYDIGIVGRPNPLLFSFLQQYVTSHPKVTYVYHKNISNQHIYYSSTGDCLGEIDTREKYFTLLKQIKVGLYSTSGMDNDKLTYEKDIIDTRGFHQVTPRFLEFLACGCHVVARYEKNADTDFFELSKFSDNVDSYKKFESAIEGAMNKPVDMFSYADYLQNHYTSSIIEKLNDIDD